MLFVSNVGIKDHVMDVHSLEQFETHYTERIYSVYVEDISNMWLAQKQMLYKLHIFLGKEIVKTDDVCHLQDRFLDVMLFRA